MPRAVTDGSSTASLNLAECLAEDFDLDLVSLRLRGNEDEIASKLTPPFSHVTLVDPDNAGNLVRRAAYRLAYEAQSRASGVPRGAFYECGRKVRDTLPRLAASTDYDLLHLEYWTTSPLLRLPIHVPKVIYFHDATFLKYEQLATAATSARSGARLARQARALREYERSSARLADAAHFLSEEDRVVLDNAGAPRGVHIPLLFRDRPSVATTASTGPNVLFLGGFGYGPNVEGATWLVEEVLPQVRTSCPEVRLRIAGPDMSDEIRNRLQAPNVDLLGWVNDLPALYADSAVVVAPLLTGTGVSVKVLEAMSYRRPIVTTTIGGRATPAISGAAIVADDARAFADGILVLLGDPNRRSELASLAHRRLYDEHMSDEVRHRVKEAFRCLMPAAAGRER